MKIPGIAWILLAAAGAYYLFTKSQSDAAAAAAAVAQTTAQTNQYADQSDWLTVPAALGVGLTSAGGIANSFKNLFSTV